MILFHSHILWFGMIKRCRMLVICFPGKKRVHVRLQASFKLLHYIISSTSTSTPLELASPSNTTSPHALAPPSRPALASRLPLPLAVHLGEVLILSFVLVTP